MAVARLRSKNTFFMEDIGLNRLNDPSADITATVAVGDQPVAFSHVMENFVTTVTGL